MGLLFLVLCSVHNAHEMDMSFILFEFGLSSAAWHIMALRHHHQLAGRCSFSDTWTSYWDLIIFLYRSGLRIRTQATKIKTNALLKDCPDT